MGKIKQYINTNYDCILGIHNVDQSNIYYFCSIMCLYHLCVYIYYS